MKFQEDIDTMDGYYNSFPVIEKYRNQIYQQFYDNGFFKECSFDCKPSIETKIEWFGHGYGGEIYDFCKDGIVVWSEDNKCYRLETPFDIYEIPPEELTTKIILETRLENALKAEYRRQIMEQRNANR